MWKWIAFIVLVVLAALPLAILRSVEPPVWLAYAASALFAGAAVLVFPPLWRERPHATARAAIAVILTALALFVPMRTHAIKLDLPRPAQH